MMSEREREIKKGINIKENGTKPMQKEKKKKD